MTQEEAPLDPEREIVDPHHHLWDLGEMPGWEWVTPFLLPEMLATIERSGHKVVQTMFVDCGAMYRADGPDELKPVGEVEFANGVAAIAASERYGPCRVAAGIVGAADLTLGGRLPAVLEAMIAAGNGRLKGVRARTAYVDSGMFGMPPDPAVKGIMARDDFRAGARQLGRYGLTLDIYCTHFQLGEVAALADACPELTIILDHSGVPYAFGPYADRGAEIFADWRRGMLALAERPNVQIKLGGLGVDLSRPFGAAGDGRSEAQAIEWRPIIETCIAAFSPARAMFESNFPPDREVCSYGALWNSFKRIVAGYSEDEKTLLFSGTARATYGLS